MTTEVIVIRLRARRQLKVPCKYAWTYLCLCQVYCRLVHTRGSDGFHKKARVSNEVLLIQRKAFRILREDSILRSRRNENQSLGNKDHIPEDRNAGDTRISECSIPHRKQRISEADDIADHALVRLTEQERFATLGIDVRVCTEEWSKGPDLIPSHEHFNIGVSKESTNVRYMTLATFLIPIDMVLPPEKVMPAIPLLNTIGTPMAMCSQVPKLSPVQTAPNRCEPAKNALDKTNGLWGGSVRCLTA